jgi:hypothetical protein
MSVTPKDVILKVGIFISILKYEVVVKPVGTVCILAIRAQDITVRIELLHHETYAYVC